MIEEIDPAELIIMVIEDKRNKRNDVVHVYALLIAYDIKKADWEKINKAIIKCWSFSALKYIKARSWNLIESWYKKENGENKTNQQG